MNPKIDIRSETGADVSAITKVTVAAFRTLEISNHTEQFIIAALRAAKALTISLVAEVDGRVIGHIAFSPLTISDGTGNWYGLGPVSVLPAYQRQGIGKALIREGLSRLKDMNAQGCCLVGHPDYYRKFGFINMPGLVHEGVPQEVFFALSFGGHTPQGTVTFHEGFKAGGQQVAPADDSSQPLSFASGVISMKEDLEPDQVEISEKILKKWQNIVDIMADTIGTPAALIMRLVKSDIEVFISSRSVGNPYQPGDHEHVLGSGLYCETVIKTRNKLLVPNALADEKWKNNPDIKLNMISYLGFPILMPDNKPFGTICVLDNKENAYSKTFEDLIKNFRDIIQSHLELLYMNMILGEKNKSLSDYLKEIKVLRGIVPICSFCKKIRDSQGNWSEADEFISKHSEAQLSHGCCPECMKEHYSDLLNDS